MINLLSGQADSQGLQEDRDSKRIEQFKDALLAIQDRICKLQWDLDSKEDYINYLEKEISIRNEELDPLRSEISNLKEQLEKTIKDSINQENYIDYLENRLTIFRMK